MFRINRSDAKIRIRKSSYFYNQIAKPKDKVYKALDCIKLSAQHWDQFLLQQLDLKTTIQQFQNVDFNSTSRNKKELLRQGYQLKRQIIQYINNENYDIIKQKLDVLANMSINQKEKEMIQTFKSLLEIKQFILCKSQLKIQENLYKKRALKILRQKSKDWFLIQDKNNTIAVKIYSIMALHYMKLCGVIMSQFQHTNVVKALQLKKKQFMMLEDQQLKKINLQSLLFMSYEYYKILRLLKSDQHQILFYYNQIITYINIFKTKFKGFQVFQKKFQIQFKIAKNKPLYLNVDIYQDSKRRRILSYQNTQDQMLNNRKSLPSKLLIPIEKKNQNEEYKNSINNSQSRCSIKKKASQIDILAINTIIQQAVSQAITANQQIQNIINPQKINQEQFNFQFSFIHSNKFIKGVFKVQFIQFSKKKTEINITIKLKDSFFYLLIYQIKGLVLSIEDMKFSIVSKNLWKALKYILKVQQEMFIQIPGFQNYAIDYIPQHINIKQELPILTQIYQTLLAKFRKTSITHLICGSSLHVDKISSTEVNFYLKNLSQKQQNQVFKKRIGFINKESIPLTLQDKNIKRIIFLYHEKEFISIQLIFKNTYLKQVIFTQNNYSINNKKFLEEMKKVSQKRYIAKGNKFLIYLIRQFTQKMLYSLYQTRYFNMNTGNIQEQLEVMNQPSLHSLKKQNFFNDYWINKKRFIKRKKKNQSYVPFRLANKLQLFQKKQFRYCDKYFNHKLQLIIDKKSQHNKKIEGIQISYKRIRMYKVILNIRKLQNVQHCWKLFLSRNFQNYQSKKIYQQLYIQLLQHKIFKINKKFYIIVQYYFKKNNSFIYQIVINQQAIKLIVQFPQKIGQIAFSPVKYTLNGKKMQQIKRRGNLSDVNSFIEQKISEKKFRVKRNITL